MYNKGHWLRSIGILKPVPFYWYLKCAQPYVRHSAPAGESIGTIKPVHFYWQLNCIQPNVQHRALAEVNWYYKTNMILLVMKLYPTICKTQDTGWGVS